MLHVSAHRPNGDCTRLNRANGVDRSGHDPAGRLLQRASPHDRRGGGGQRQRWHYPGHADGHDFREPRGTPPLTPAHRSTKSGDRRARGARAGPKSNHRPERRRRPDLRNCHSAFHECRKPRPTEPAGAAWTGTEHKHQNPLLRPLRRWVSVRTNFRQEDADDTSLQDRGLWACRLPVTPLPSAQSSDAASASSSAAVMGRVTKLQPWMRKESRRFRSRRGASTKATTNEAREYPYSFMKKPNAPAQTATTTSTAVPVAV